MEPVEHDVYICYREPGGRALAELVKAGLSRRGFHVIPWDEDAGAESMARRLKLIEEAPDFVLVLSPGDLDERTGPSDPMRQELARALETGRIIVPVIAPGFGRYPVRALPADIARIGRYPAIAYDPSNSPETVARVSHALSSDTTVDDRRLMRFARRAFIAAGVFVAGILIVEIALTVPKMLARKTEPPPVPPMSLYWSSFAERPHEGGWTEFELRDGASVASGDQVRLVFSPSADGFAYVLAKNLRGEVHVLFPSHELRGAARVAPGRVYEAPGNAGWLTVDAREGLAALYIVASYDPIENLEELAEEQAQEVNRETRRDLLASTIGGLIDGRHGPSDFKIRARNGRAILRSLPPSAGPSHSSALLSNGALVTHPLAAEPGLLSALVELRLQYQPARTGGDR